MGDTQRPEAIQGYARNERRCSPGETLSLRGEGKAELFQTDESMVADDDVMAHTRVRRGNPFKLAENFHQYRFGYGLENAIAEEKID